MRPPIGGLVKIAGLVVRFSTHPLNRAYDDGFPAYVAAADALRLAGLPRENFVNLPVFKPATHEARGERAAQVVNGFTFRNFGVFLRLHHVAIERV